MAKCGDRFETEKANKSETSPAGGERNEESDDVAASFPCPPRNGVNPPRGTAEEGGKERNEELNSTRGVTYVFLAAISSSPHDGAAARVLDPPCCSFYRGMRYRSNQSRHIRDVQSVRFCTWRASVSRVRYPEID